MTSSQNVKLTCTKPDMDAGNYVIGDIMYNATDASMLTFNGSAFEYLTDNQSSDANAVWNELAEQSVLRIIGTHCSLLDDLFVEYKTILDPKGTLYSNESITPTRFLCEVLERKREMSAPELSRLDALYKEIMFYLEVTK